jgi:hypothetical protein
MKRVASVSQRSQKEQQRSSSGTNYYPWLSPCPQKCSRCNITTYWWPGILQPTNGSYQTRLVMDSIGCSTHHAVVTPVTSESSVVAEPHSKNISVVVKNVPNHLFIEGKPDFHPAKCGLLILNLQHELHQAHRWGDGPDCPNTHRTFARSCVSFPLFPPLNPSHHSREKLHYIFKPMQCTNAI